MPKVHFTPNYTYPNDGSIRAISVCGLHSGIADKNFIDCTIVKIRVNCKNCLRVMNAAKKLQQPPVIKSVCDVCGSDDVIEAPHMGKNCNRCHPL